MSRVGEDIALVEEFTARERARSNLSLELERSLMLRSKVREIVKELLASFQFAQASPSVAAIRIWLDSLGGPFLSKSRMRLFSEFVSPQFQSVAASKMCCSEAFIWTLCEN